MANFAYYGRNEKGMAIRGCIERATENDVLHYLSEKRITPINIEEQELQKKFGDILSQYLIVKKGIDNDQLIMFCRQMRTINKAGLPLIQGLEALSSSIPPGVLQGALQDIIHRLESGLSLSQSMKYHRNIFNNLFIGMVKIGESTGRLDEIFWQMSIYIGRDMETKKAMKAALRYPSFVLSAMVIALFVVNLMVIPAFANMFGRFGAELPIATKVLLATSQFFIQFWWLVIVAMLSAITGLIFWVKTPEGKLVWHRIKLFIPIIGPLINKAAISRYVRSFSLMVSEGLPLNTAIELCAEIIDNVYLSLKIRKIKSGIERGDSIYRTHYRSNMFSPLILQMINIGENSGQIDNLLIEVAESYEREVDYDLKSLSSKIEPILILVMAGFIVVLALGIFLPMWEMFNIQR
ncbi:MSHA biogenesis protein MshG [Candidatus Endobugula sertula]|uniref:MSHA biogenesis protein MshG n=1 Tax=Candidatus Endobugula sertula TaxID=62101 RepID=A0A1D2QP49_9GAMM|nr:MSHA biogenesis protein MshG [Candidatus Endobugula sertula]